MMRDTLTECIPDHLGLQINRLNALLQKEEEAWQELKSTIDEFCGEGEDADLDT